MNEVTLRRARLVLGWVTGTRGPTAGAGNSHPGQLSLAIPPWLNATSTSQRAVMPCGWGTKAGMVREWVAGKTV